MPKPSVDPFSIEEVKILSAALAGWAKNHPDPDAPAVSFGFHGQALTPSQIAAVVKAHGEGNETRDSEAILRMYRYMSEEIPFADIVRHLVELASLNSDTREVEQ